MSLADVQLRLVDSFDEASAFVRWLGERRPVLGIDTESTGLDRHRDRLRLVQAGDAMTGWALPYEGAGWGGLLAEKLPEYEGRVVYHNAPFDMHFLRKSGVNVDRLRSNTHDTSTLACVLDPTRRRDLKGLGARYVGMAADAGQKLLKDQMRKHGWNWGTVPLDLPAYWTYSALDPVITARLWEAWQPELAADEGLQRVYELEMAVLHIIADMQGRGLPVDEEYTRSTRDELLRDEEDARNWIGEFYPQFVRKHGVVLPDAGIAAALVRDGAVLTKRTATNQLSVDKEVLAELVEDFPLAAAIQKIRRTSKFRKTYFEAILDNLHGGRVFPSINPMGSLELGTRTGRMSVSNPPFQQLPSGSPLVRDCIAPGEGRKLLSIDYDQIEWKVFAHYAADPELTAQMAGGEDFHLVTARIIYGPNVTKKGPERKKSKGIGFGKLYGAGPAKTASQLGISEDEVLGLIAQFDQAIPAVARMSREVINTVYERQREGRGFIRTWAGRRSYVEPGREYAGLNYLCVTPDTPVLREDLRHVPAGEIKVGDRVVGFDEHPDGKYRRLRPAIVEKAVRIVKPTLRVHMADGREVVCSTDHQWLVRRNRYLSWRTVTDMRPGDELLSTGTLRPERLLPKATEWWSGMAITAGATPAVQVVAIEPAGHQEVIALQTSTRTFVANGFLSHNCQGTAADILKQKLVDLEAAGLAQYVLLPVHDEFIFEVPEDSAEEILREAESVMADNENFAVPITASGEVLSRWGDPYRTTGE